MSRVSEALRRGMNRDVVGDVVPACTDARIALDLEERLADEPFPLEMPDMRTAPANPFAPAAGVEAPSPVKPAARPRPVAEQFPTRLMERMDAGLAQKIVIDHSTMPFSREQYRRLAASLHHAQGAAGLKVVLIGSALPGEGKTLTAANLALTLSESYKRTVLLIDADLRRPSQHQLFQIENAAGLSDGLSAVTGKPLRVRQISQRLALLPAGEPTSDPMAGLTSPRMHRVIAEAREMFDWVIIDTPPLGLLPDANLLSTFVDGAILVIKAGSTSYYSVKRAVDAIGRAKLLGIVLNRAERNAAISHYNYYDTYYGARPGKPA